MRLLLVEDDPLLQRSLAAALREEGYAVDASGDGREGLFKARETGYDAIILDIMLPGLDGWQILSRLRPVVRTPVLLLTARDTVPDRVKGLDHGADDYLTKPFDLDELLARLRALIRRSAGRVHPAISLGAVELDTAAREARLDGAPVPLTAREYSLLEYIALHRGKVVSRAELY